MCVSLSLSPRPQLLPMFVQGGDLLVCGPKNDVVAALTPESTTATWLVSSGVLGDAALLPQLYALAMSLSPGKDVNTAAVNSRHERSTKL